MYNYIDEMIKWMYFIYINLLIRDINIMREYFKVYSLVD